MVNSECSHGFRKRPLALVYAAMALKKPTNIDTESKEDLTHLVILRNNDDVFHMKLH